MTSWLLSLRRRFLELFQTVGNFCSIDFYQSVIRFAVYFVYFSRMCVCIVFPLAYAAAAASSSSFSSACLIVFLLLLFLNCFEFFDWKFRVFFPCNQNEFDFRSSLFVANSYCCWFELALVILANIENYWYSIKTAWLNMCLCV